MKAIRKWEWVRDYCIQHCFIESAEIADQIDRVLYYLYGNNDTLGWEEFVAKSDKDKIANMSLYTINYQIISNTDFCIACHMRGYGGVCADCDFAALVGDCGGDDSLFGEFINVFYNEIKKVGVDENEV
jgi:hypothetical protein